MMASKKYVPMKNIQGWRLDNKPFVTAPRCNLFLFVSNKSEGSKKHHLEKMPNDEITEANHVVDLKKRENPILKTRLKIHLPLFSSLFLDYFVLFIFTVLLQSWFSTVGYFILYYLIVLFNTFYCF